MDASPQPNNNHLQAVYRLQGELRSLERQQSTKILINDSERLEDLIQKEHELLRTDQNEYERLVASLKKPLEERQPTFPPLEISSVLMENLTSAAQLQLSRLHSTNNHRFNQLTRKVEKDVKKTREELYALVEHSKVELVSQNQSLQRSLTDLKQHINRSNDSAPDSRQFQLHLNGIINQKLNQMDQLFRSEVNCMTEQNRHLTTLIEEAGQQFSEELNREREQCRLMMQRHYERLQHCVELLLERG